MRELRADPAQRSSVLRRYWAGSEGSLLNVTVDGHTGVPHAAPLPTPARPARGARGARGAHGAHGARPLPTQRRTDPSADALHYKKPTARGTALGTRGPDAWCGDTPSVPTLTLTPAPAPAPAPAPTPTLSPTLTRCGDTPSVACGCQYDGMHGDACESRHEAFCLNQCSGHGRCDAFGGACHCDAGFFGVDCSLTTAATTVTSGAAGGREVALHAAHAARAAPRRPFVYVYELPRMTSLILQYRANGGMCAHRNFGPSNETQFNGGWVYTSDVEP